MQIKVKKKTLSKYFNKVIHFWDTCSIPSDVPEFQAMCVCVCDGVAFLS